MVAPSEEVGQVKRGQAKDDDKHKHTDSTCSVPSSAGRATHKFVRA